MSDESMSPLENLAGLMEMRDEMNGVLVPWVFLGYVLHQMDPRHGVYPMSAAQALQHLRDRCTNHTRVEQTCDRRAPSCQSRAPLAHLSPGVQGACDFAADTIVQSVGGHVDHGACLDRHCEKAAHALQSHLGHGRFRCHDKKILC